MATRGFYSIRGIMTEDSDVFHDSPSPWSEVPVWVTGINSVDKKTSAEEKRRVSDKTAPHDDAHGEPTRERHSAHGKPAGDAVVPHNLLTGNSRRLKQEDKLYPREDKTSLPVMYSVLVYLCHASHVSGVALYGGKIDYRWFFYAFRKHPY